MSVKVLTTEDRILKQRMLVMKDHRFISIAGIMMVGSWKVVDAPVTAATNGAMVVYGRKFVDSIDDPTLRFVILHEYYHILLLHLIVWKHLWNKVKVQMPNGAETDLANLAADFVINIMLDKAAGARADNFIKVWEHACLDYQYDGMDTEAVFNKLLQQAQQNSGGGSGKNKNGAKLKVKAKAADGGDAQEMDTHEPQEGDADGNETDVGGDQKEKYCGGKLNEQEIKDLRRQIDEALRQGKQVAGKGGGKWDRSLDGLLETTVDWRELLQDFVKTHAAGNDLSTWRRLNRRWMSRDIMQPSRYTEAAKRITIGVDTSGSIGESQLKKALSEIKGACDTVHPECVDIIYWDWAVAGHETYEGDQVERIVDFTKPVGGGGTQVGCMLEYMNAQNIKPDCIIIFTDGYLEPGLEAYNWPAPTLWCVSEQGFTSPTGKTLYVPVE